MIMTQKKEIIPALGPRVFKSQTLENMFDDRRSRGLKIQIKANFLSKNHRERAAILSQRLRLIFKGRPYKLPTNVNRKRRSYFEEAGIPHERVRSQWAMLFRQKLPKNLQPVKKSPDEVKLTPKTPKPGLLKRAANWFRKKDQK